MRIRLLFLKWGLQQWLEADLPLSIARRLPRWLRYWVAIDSIAKATTGEYSDTIVPELPAMKVLERI